ncbi:type II secretion system protein N [Dyella solisilvae]|uniref:Type II secretion system protein N n=1 Tax=Dyella solisilvae TaxID=1920168 RepID=A0A370KC36_9GAMM|nr:type II secretion system protein N [Dyella solisilvae]RDJ00213.1 type II secretion system protein N [Dyella solisilvae]
MKHSRTALVGLLALLSLAAVLVWFMPARWAMPWLGPRLGGLRLEQVSGLLWEGAAGRVLSARGEDLGRLTWQLSRRALLGDNQLQLRLQGERADFAGRMAGKAVADAHWTDVQMRIDLELLGNSLALPLGQPRGVVELAARDIQLHGGWPEAMDAQLHWQAAMLQTPRHGELPLGGLQMTLQAANGVIEGHLQDEGDGPLRIDGQLQLSPLARRFTAEAAVRQANSPLQHWLSGLGATDAQGITHINYTGGLAAAMSGGTR